MKLKNNVIIACDFISKEDLLKFLDKFGNEKPFLKIGLQLFLKEGKPLIKELLDRSFNIFLDLKLHDIPKTISLSLDSFSDLNISFITVHGLVGPETIEYISKKLNKVAVVTLLTSLNDNDLNIIFDNQISVKQQVMRIVDFSYKKGARIFICSVSEAKMIKFKYPDTTLICPGIRYSSPKHDQKRVSTPSEAKVSGADYIVVGREITLSNDPVKTYLEIRKKFHD